MTKDEALKNVHDELNKLLMEVLLTVAPHETGGDPCCVDALATMEDFEEALSAHSVELMPLGEAIFEYAKVAAPQAEAVE